MDAICWTGTMRTSSRRRTGMRSRYGGLASVSYASIAAPTCDACSATISACSMRSCARFTVSRQPRLLDRLQQIVDRIDFERADSVLVVGGNEGDQRHRVLLQHPDDPNAIEFRHLPVK